MIATKKYGNLLTIAETESALSLSPIRVRNLEKEGKLVGVMVPKPTKNGTMNVLWITEQSVLAYETYRRERDAKIAQRKAEKLEKATIERKNSKQYIVSLTPEQAAQLAEMGYSIKPRFANNETNVVRETIDDDFEIIDDEA